MKKPEDFTDEMLNNILFNYNRPVAIDIKTLSNGEMIEICFAPLNSKYEIAKSLLPFWSYIKPKQSPIYVELDPEARYREVFGVSEALYYKAFNEGIDKIKLFEIFEDWFEKKIKLVDEGRKLLPITYDWATKKPILIDWMGQKNFDYYFHFHVRDILPLALFFNDWAIHNIERPPFQKVDIGYIASSIKVRDNSQDTLVRANAIIQIYKYMIQHIQAIL